MDLVSNATNARIKPIGRLGRNTTRKEQTIEHKSVSNMIKKLVNMNLLNSVIAYA